MIMEKAHDKKLEKSGLRTTYQGLTNEFVQAHVKTELDVRICKNLLDVLPEKPGLIGGYKSKDEGEVEIAHLQELRPDCLWAFPQVEGRDLRFAIPLDHDFIAGRFGIQEPNPKTAKPATVAEMTALVVPGLAFDRRGARLGRGLGFYDRTMKGFSGLKIGVAYSVQIATHDLVTEPHDEFVDVLVTESYALKV